MYNIIFDSTNITLMIGKFKGLLDVKIFVVMDLSFYEVIGKV